MIPVVYKLHHAHRLQRCRQHCRNGAAAVLAMMFLVLLVTLSLAMYATATMNLQSAANLSGVQRARMLAESGLRWQSYRFRVMDRPIVSEGNLTYSVVADKVWPLLMDDIEADWLSLPGGGVGTITRGSDFIECSGVQIDDRPGAFAVRVERLASYSTDPTSPEYRHFIRVTSTGSVGDETRQVRRSVQMDFLLDKRIKFAVVGKTRIQLGRNTLVEGPVAMATTGRYPPVLILSDFDQLDPALTSRVRDFQNWLENNHSGYDGRVSIHHPVEGPAVLSAGFSDYNLDGYVDEFDLFMEHYDSNGDLKIDRAEFSVGGELIEPELWRAIDNLGAPLFAGDVLRDGWNDDVIDNRDAYAKIRGYMQIAPTHQAWENQLSSSDSIHNYIQGPMIPDPPGTEPVQFGVQQAAMIDLNPANFEGAAEGFEKLAGPASDRPTARTYRQARDASGTPLFDAGGNPVQEVAVVANAVLTVADASLMVDAGGNPVPERTVEQTPLGSASYQATYDRPVFRDMHFKNVIVPKGMNALFENCTFEGSTFVDMERDIVVNGKVTTSNSDGMKWSKRMKSGSFSKNKALDASNSHGAALGNNIRFNNCEFRGPIAGKYSTAYTHFTNSWEFTGSTKFEIDEDEEWKKTATIVAPNTNIEMGSFTNPNDAPSTLVGVVVAGNIDIRGTSIVDGSVIVTGDGAGNTTLGYFGPDDADTDPTAMPDGGFGLLNVRYNPYRALPDGILIPVDILADADTYREGL
ncbi:MAG: hypothetical protein ACFCVE_12505 [Phycisphaerae bacterium]